MVNSSIELFTLSPFENNVFKHKKRLASHAGAVRSLRAPSTKSVAADELAEDPAEAQKADPAADRRRNLAGGRLCFAASA
jgi:hypothetical protein